MSLIDNKNKEGIKKKKHCKFQTKHEGKKYMIYHIYKKKKR